jgi:hypothetical protein
MVYEEPEETLDTGGDLDWLFEEHGEVGIQHKKELPPRDDIIKYDPEVHAKEIDNNVQWRGHPHEHRTVLRAIIEKFFDVFALEGMQNHVRGFEFNIPCKSSKDRTAFFSSNGKKHWNSMPMGAMNAHAFFVAMVSKMEIKWNAPCGERTRKRKEIKWEWLTTKMEEVLCTIKETRDVSDTSDSHKKHRTAGHFQKGNHCRQSSKQQSIDMCMDNS